MICSRRASTLGAAVLAVALVLPAPLALAATVTPTPAASAGSAQPSPSASGSAVEKPVVTFGIGPSKKGKIDRRSNFAFLTPRGTTVTDEVAVVNLTLEPLTLNLYAADAVNGPDGTLGLEPSAKEPVDAASWVTFATPTGKGYVVLAPRETRFVEFTVTVPEDALVGDHLAGVIASTVSQGATPGERTTDITFEQRIGLRLAIRVAGELNPQLTVQDMSATYAGSLNPFAKGTAVVTYTVRNTGNVRLGGSQRVTVSGLFGSTAVATGVPDIPLLLPGGSATVSVPVDGVLPAIYLNGTVTVTVLAAAGDANPPAEPVVATVGFWAIPWTLFALITALLLILGAWWRRRVTPAITPGGRRSRHEPELVDAGRVRPPSA